MEIILVRHGQSKANKNNPQDTYMCTGQLDWPLTFKGKMQAYKLKHNKELRNADAYFVSPLKRTIQTASFFVSKKKMIIEPRIIERGLGEFEGRYVYDLKQIDKYKKYFTDPTYMCYQRSFEITTPGGETFTDVCNRVTDFFKEVFAKNYKKIVIVSHHDAINCMIHVLTHASKEETLRRVIKKCETIVYNIDKFE